MGGLLPRFLREAMKPAPCVVKSDSLQGDSKRTLCVAPRSLALKSGDNRCPPPRPVYLMLGWNLAR